MAAAEPLAGLTALVRDDDRAAFVAMLEPGYQPANVDTELQRLVKIRLRELEHERRVRRV